MNWIDGNGKAQRAGQAWAQGVRVERKPHDPEAHVITSVGAFAFCRRDRFCRCRKCKPSLGVSND